MKLARATGIIGGAFALASLAWELGRAVYEGVQEARHRRRMRRIEEEAAKRRAGQGEPRPEPHGPGR